MSLTKQDLGAIGKLIEASGRRLENRLVARIDDLDDVLSLQVERGLQEVREDISALKTVVDRIDQVQQTELARNDRRDADIKKIRKTLHAA
ncbi:MAG: hypothetical protein ACREJM_09865 [Candidatus Saccharimonadales bacterium]